MYRAIILLGIKRIVALLWVSNVLFHTQNKSFTTSILKARERSVELVFFFQLDVKNVSTYEFSPSLYASKVKENRVVLKESDKEKVKYKRDDISLIRNPLLSIFHF